MPLYGLERLHESGAVFIHEGPKSVADLLTKLKNGNHPWQHELENAVHVGWHGGARNSHRTDWATLRNVNCAYIVPDNDDVGREAIRPISRNLRCPTRVIQFDDRFPCGFDLGDPFPDFEITPSFSAHIQPATFVTEEIPKGKGDKSKKKHYRLRKPAQWDPNKSDRMLAALRTAAGKQPSCKFVAIGTKPAQDEHWFSRMLAGGADYAQCHAADAEDNPFVRKTWRKANPSLARMPDLLDAIRVEAAEAKTDPAALAMFKSLRLNLGTWDTTRAHS